MPARAAPSASTLRRVAGPSVPRPDARRSAGSAARARSSTTNPTAPRAMIATLASNPGDGSARRAGPIGTNGDTASAPSAARTAPIVAINPTRISPTTTTCVRVKPSARKVP